MKLRILIILFLGLLIVSINAQECGQRPTYQIGYNAPDDNNVEFYSYQGTEEILRGPNNVICAAGVKLEDCETHSILWTAEFTIPVYTSKIKYYVEIYRVPSNQDLSWLTHYEFISQSQVVELSNHFPSNLYTVSIATIADPNYTYRARVRWKRRIFWNSWQNNLTNSWNLYSAEGDNSVQCPIGSWDTANCYIMNKPQNGFIYENCFYVPAQSSSNCPNGTLFENGYCKIQNAPSGNFFTTGILVQENKLYQTLNSGQTCTTETTELNLGGVKITLCLIYKPPWGYILSQGETNWRVNTERICPSNYGYDGANCIYDCAPCGRDAFEYQGAWYISAN